MMNDAVAQASPPAHRLQAGRLRYFRRWSLNQIRICFNPPSSPGFRRCSGKCYR